MSRTADAICLDTLCTVTPGRKSLFLSDRLPCLFTVTTSSTTPTLHSCLHQQLCVITSNPFPSPLHLISLLTSPSTAPPLPLSSCDWRARSQSSVQSCLVFGCVCVVQQSRWRKKGRGDRGRDERGVKEHGRQLKREPSMKWRMADDRTIQWDIYSLAEL